MGPVVDRPKILKILLNLTARQNIFACYLGLLELINFVQVNQTCCFKVYCIVHEMTETNVLLVQF